MCGYDIEKPLSLLNLPFQHTQDGTLIQEHVDLDVSDGQPLAKTSRGRKQPGVGPSVDDLRDRPAVPSPSPAGLDLERGHELPRYRSAGRRQVVLSE